MDRDACISSIFYRNEKIGEGGVKITHDLGHFRKNVKKKLNAVGGSIEAQKTARLLIISRLGAFLADFEDQFLLLDLHVVLLVLAV